ncbi:ABC transporter permease [Fonticella tunisiensis]|uniref:Oligopeptide transport system permease protein n=1 Tax=Fonticella tunisiensis TaxID=1096341 RepID=A0A4R7KPW9_9CLOT|nr:ABC transporter permease [Fonticella tunisiensis]TDT61065.1 oligopeptide transport system permease protein [Fonticella tunisiensis]
MTRFVIRRLGYMVLTMWVIITVTFFLMNTIPGDPISVKAKKLPPQIQENIRRKYGLDKPVYLRYIDYLKNVIKGDLGESIETPGLTANQIIRERFPVSARLGLQGVTFGLIIGLILGIVAAFRRNSWIDYLVMFIAILGISVPSFVIAVLLQYFFSGGILPTVGWPTVNVWTSGFKFTILPTIALSFGSIATYARYMRASVLDVVNQDYILTARAKGVSNVAIIWKHIIRNAILPIITILGPQIAGVITGSFIIERIFSIPGLGEYYVQSINNRDYTMIMATTIFFAALYIISLLVVDILYGVIDPRIRVTGEKR